MTREVRDKETGLPIISTPGNGKRWAWDTISKIVAAVLTIVLVALWTRAGTIIGLPPRMDRAEESIKQLQVAVASPRPMTSPEINALAAAIVQALPKKDKR